MLAIANAPMWLVQLSTEPASEARPAHKFMSSGHRNDDLMSLAGMLRRKGGDEEFISRVLHAANDNAPEPLPSAEVQGVASGSMRYPPDTLSGLTQQTFSDLLAQRASARGLFCPEWGWMEYEGRRWTRDKENLQILATAKTIATELASEAERMAERDPVNAKSYRQKGRSCQTRNFLMGAIDLAAADASIRAKVEEFDARPSLFNMLNGTLDTATGVFQSHSPADRLTKLADVEYDASATCPTFDRFMTEVLATDVTDFLMRSAAYALLGLGNEQKLVILIGKGRNGKSTFTSVIENIFGDYAVAADPRTFSLRNEDSIRNDVARLAGSRLVTTTEFRSGTILDPALIKKITGGDKVTARHLYQESFEFKGRFLPILVTNYAPIIEGSDDALTSRLIMVRFDRVFAKDEIDKSLPDKLEAEKPGILNRILEALQEYRSIGLAVPASILEVTEGYVNEANLFARFLDEACQMGDEFEVEASTLYWAYRSWCHGEYVQPVSQPVFKRTLEGTFALEQKRKAQGKVWRGIRVARRADGR